MKSIKTGEWFGMFFLMVIGLLACHSDKQERTQSDSALTAPADTLGKDTSRKNPVGDTAKVR